ncbi:26426_t:CDS:2 [Dentiscutata erythropus]|uniref:26426_t:CDS:1 n=1 Tax=Dentiscutata erythropus TaxID=1348616 RepID=A0A9N9AMC5_9GLOM|nr:26426_t:CDS:2 [Dentiscutata erythropus]
MNIKANKISVEVHIIDVASILNADAIDEVGDVTTIDNDEMSAVAINIIVNLE